LSLSTECQREFVPCFVNCHLTAIEVDRAPFQGRHLAAPKPAENPEQHGHKHASEPEMIYEFRRLCRIECPHFPTLHLGRVNIVGGAAASRRAQQGWAAASGR
jgi:hypothetical protein